MGSIKKSDNQCLGSLNLSASERDYELRQYLRAIIGRGLLHIIINPKCIDPIIIICNNELISQRVKTAFEGFHSHWIHLLSSQSGSVHNQELHHGTPETFTSPVVNPQLSNSALVLCATVDISWLLDELILTEPGIIDMDDRLFSISSSVAHLAKTGLPISRKSGWELLYFR